MKQAVEVSILGHKFMVRSDSSEEYINEVARYVDSKMQEVMNNTKSVASLNVAILASMNIADEYLKIRKDKEAKLKIVKKKVQDMIELVDLQL